MASTRGPYVVKDNFFRQVVEEGYLDLNRFSGKNFTDVENNLGYWTAELRMDRGLDVQPL
ncbi:hypothetical protein [Rubripirellula amarantea]|uniref:hypothetical protein n=1 Tax=Rubripirellula amarantea TaxID=2527999 RepID=UPI001F5F1B40|nr:hypothetical protein [Rubripirellula amarantea]